MTQQTLELRHDHQIGVTMFWGDLPQVMGAVILRPRQAQVTVRRGSEEYTGTLAEVISQVGHDEALLAALAVPDRVKRLGTNEGEVYTREDLVRLASNGSDEERRFAREILLVL